MLDGNMMEMVTKDTTPKTNMSPKKEPFQKESSLPTTIFQVTCYKKIVG